MLRQPLPQPHMNGHGDYDGDIPEDDYSDFNAWGEDFDGDGDDQDYTEPDVPPPGALPRRNNPAPPPGSGSMFQGRAVPPPPGNGPALPPSDEAPPPLAPRARGGRAAPPLPTTERSSDVPPALPSRGHAMQPPPLPQQESDEDDDNYMEPQTTQDADGNETYEDPNEVPQHQTPHHQPQMRNQGRELPPPPPPIDDDMYQCPDEEDLPSQGPPVRQFPPPPQQQVPKPPPSRSMPKQPLPPLPSRPADPDDDETYDIPDEVIPQPQVKPASRGPVPGNGPRSLPPEPEPGYPEPARNASIKGGPAPSGPKMVDTISLRQKINILKPVNQVFDNPPNTGSMNNKQDTEEDHTIGQIGVSGMIAKLAKQNSMFQKGAKKNVTPSYPKTSPSPATRRLPEPPQDYPSTQHRLSDTSSQSAASDDNSSGSGSVGPIRRAVDPLPPVPQPVPQPVSQPVIQPKEIKPPPKRTVRVEDEYWYFDIDRTETHEKLREGGDGMFLVRSSKLGGPGSPYTMCIYYKKRVWNLKIRLRSDKRYALGTAHDNETTFETVSDMVTHHHSTHITLAGCDSGQVLLKESPDREDIYDGTW